MNILIHAHSGLRWIVLILFVYAIANAFSGKSSGREYLKKDKMVNLFTMVSMHIMLLVGLILLFTSGKVDFANMMADSTRRFYALEHPVAMILATVLVTIGRKKGEGAQATPDKFRNIIKWYTIALILILASIPWPFRIAGAGWA
ncbi:MAG: hypothetical protein KDC84_02615 [Crocinitomicaceae bacterium]|nr:hypothetical protein [Crocinitomicaceae bacterium]